MKKNKKEIDDEIKEDTTEEVEEKDLEQNSSDEVEEKLNSESSFYVYLRSQKCI